MESVQPIVLDPEPQRVLIVLPSWVGDVVMSTPFLDVLFKRFQAADISLLMYEHLNEILQGGPWTKRCHYWPGANASRSDTRKWLKTLRAERFDLVVLLPNSFRVAWVAWRIGATRRVGFARDGRSLFLTDAVIAPNRRGRKFEPMPLVKYYAHLAAHLGCESPGDNLRLFTSHPHDSASEQKLRQAGVSENAKIVTLCPGANFGASKCWHPERFAQVADRLVRDHGVTVVLSPGPGEEPLAMRIAETMKERHVLLSRPCLSLGELKSLIRRSVLLLGNDTGPRHYARAFDTPRVTIFGPTEQMWTETTHKKETIIQVSVPCGPCQEKICPRKERICMDRISVGMVFQACSALLPGNEPSSLTE